MKTLVLTLYARTKTAERSVAPAWLDLRRPAPALTSKEVKDRPRRRTPPTPVESRTGPARATSDVGGCDSQALSAIAL